LGGLSYPSPLISQEKILGLVFAFGPEAAFASAFPEAPLAQKASFLLPTTAGPERFSALKSAAEPSSAATHGEEAFVQATTRRKAINTTGEVREGERLLATGVARLFQNHGGRNQIGYEA